MPTPRKASQIAALADKLGRAKLAIVADYRGLKVKDLSALRRQLGGHHSELEVAKNTLLTKAAADAGINVGTALFKGPTAIAFCFDDVVEPAKVIADFARTSRTLSVRGRKSDRGRRSGQFGYVASSRPAARSVGWNDQWSAQQYGRCA